MKREAKLTEDSADGETRDGDGDGASGDGLPDDATPNGDEARPVP